MVLAGIVFLMSAILLLFYENNRVEGSRDITMRTPVAAEHHVLFLSSYGPQYFTADDQEAGLAESLYPHGVEFDTVYMESKLHPSEEEELAFYDLLAVRLSNAARNYEAVIAGDDAALEFVLKYRDGLFAGLPVVFFGINDLSLAERASKEPLTAGLYENNYLGDTLSLAHELFPGAKRFVSLHDDSAAGREDNRLFYLFAKAYSSIEFTDLNSQELSHTELMSELEALPEDTVILFMTCYTDRDGHVHSVREMTSAVALHTHGLPVFRNYTGGEGEGVLGGVVMDFVEHCRLAGEMVNKSIDGEDISDLRLEITTPGRTEIDYALLEHYGLLKHELPADTIYINRPESFISRYRNIFLPVILMLAALILFFVSVEISNRALQHSADELRASRDDLRESQEQLKQRAEYDDFLHIMNRRTITEHLHNDFTRDSVYTVMMADLDKFQSVNEDYGHKMADEILKYLTTLIKELCDKNGWLVGRYGGDEYLFIVPGVQLTAEHALTQMLLTLFRMPVPAGEMEARLSASVGISVSDGETTPEQHIINAEIAMYDAKDRGRDRAVLFAEETKAKMREENRIKGKLTEAFQKDGFYMVYQPQIDAKTKEVSGFEALVRMREQGIYPGQFIPVAEANGWIWRIGRITTRLVIEQLAAWRDAGITLHPVSINYSSNQLNDTGYLDYVEALLKKHDIPPQYLEIEITEGIFLDRTAQANHLFDRFKELGIRLLMDDFGTGYSSLGYLTYIPVDVIKLDKSLVDAYLVDGKDSFVRDVILLVHDLGKEIIIEGVEEEWQYERLREFGANTIQGYYFSKPLPPEEAIQYNAK